MQGCKTPPGQFPARSLFAHTASTLLALGLTFPASAQRVPPPRPPARPLPGVAGPATPPQPPGVTMPSGPVIPPRLEPTGAPVPLTEPNQAVSPNAPPAAGAEAAAQPATLADFEALAMQNNPSLVQAEANVNVSRARSWQAGFWHNPHVGYVGEHIAARTGEGPVPALGQMQGGIFKQEIPTANKRQISRRKFQWEAESARWLVEVQKWKIINGVRIHFYETLAAQQLVDERTRDPQDHRCRPADNRADGQPGRGQRL